MLGCDLYSDFIVSSYIAEKLAYFFSPLTLYFFYSLFLAPTAQVEL